MLLCDCTVDGCCTALCRRSPGAETDDNPGRITAFGQSAGAASILALMCMPDAQGLFKRCIIQSPCVEHFFTPEESLKNAELFMRVLGAHSPEDILSLPEDRIIEAAEKYERGLMLRGDIRCAFSPIIDGRFLPVAPVEGVKQRPLPMLIGNTLKEGDFFLQPYPTALLPFIAGYLHVKIPRGEDRYRHRASDGLTQKVFLEPMERLLRDYNAPVWKYEYRHGENLGHSGELPTLFDATDDATGLEMRRIWGQFARTGQLDWPEYGLSQYVYGFD